ncbi:MAG TPA: hypothetical protein VJ583_08925 [Nitrososphaeraceae archaeon]|jgi:hypothetical protein|nr:hypothetical protein [Nitrososphaeraceae archaeon]
MNNRISKNNIYVNLLTIGFILFSLLLSTNIYATHISEPILSLDKDAKYNLNETISINGWVKYDDKPTSDVLVLLKLINPNGNEIFQDQVRSDSNGNFTSNIKLIGSNVTEGGTFTLYAESQCRDEHRNICNHNNSSQTLVVIN